MFHLSLLLGLHGPKLSNTTALEEGISINFGNQDFGSGQEQSEDILEDQEISPQNIVNNNPEIEDISTQNIEETTTTKLKEQLDKAKEEKNIEKKKPESIINTKALYTGKKQNKIKNQITNEEQGNKGIPDGDPNSNTYTGDGIGTNGISYQLGGRSIAEIKKPNYDSQQQGKVVVTIRVNRKGKVISASPGAKALQLLTPTYILKLKRQPLKLLLKLILQLLRFS